MKRCAWNNGVQNVAGLQRNADGSNMPCFLRGVLFFLLWRPWGWVPKSQAPRQSPSMTPPETDSCQCPSSASSLRLGNWKTNMLRELFEPGPGRQPVILALPWCQKVVDVGGLWTVQRRSEGATMAAERDAHAKVHARAHAQKHERVNMLEMSFLPSTLFLFPCLFSFASFAGKRMTCVSEFGSFVPRDHWYLPYEIWSACTSTTFVHLLLASH